MCSFWFPEPWLNLSPEPAHSPSVPYPSRGQRNQHQGWACWNGSSLGTHTKYKVHPSWAWPTALHFPYPGWTLGSMQTPVGHPWVCQARLGGSLCALWVSSWWIRVFLAFSPGKAERFPGVSLERISVLFSKVWPKMERRGWKRSPCILVTFWCSDKAPWWKHVTEESLCLGILFQRVRVHDGWDGRSRKLGIHLLNHIE